MRDRIAGKRLPDWSFCYQSRASRREDAIFAYELAGHSADRKTIGTVEIRLVGYAHRERGRLRTERFRAPEDRNTVTGFGARISIFSKPSTCSRSSALPRVRSRRARLTRSSCVTRLIASPALPIRAVRPMR